MKRSRLQQTSLEVTVGAFIFMILLALGFFTIVLSRENIFSKSYEMTVRFDDVSGLIKGDKVYVHGVDVGRVKAMTIHDDGIHILLSLRNKIQLHEDYNVSVEPSSILGGRFVDLDPGSNDSPHLTEEKSALLEGQPPVDLIREATDAVKSVRNSLEGGGVLKNLETTMANLSDISTDLKAGKGTIGKLLEDESVYNELKEVSTNLKELTAKLNKGEGSLGKLLNDDKVYNDVQEITTNLKKVSEDLAQGKGTIGKLISEDDTLYDDLAASAKSIREITSGIDKGEGTLGKLAKDDEVYDQLNKLLTEVRATVDDLRETSPVATFSSVFFGAF